MAEGSRPNFCENCGTRLQSGDKFCGTCGAAVLSPPSQAEQVIPQQVAASHAPSRRRRLPVILAVSILAVLLIGTGALATVAYRGGFGRSEGAESQPPVAETEPTTPQAPPEEETTVDEINSDPDEVPSPDQDSDVSSEDAIESFIFEYYDAVARRDWENTYSLLADDSQGEFTEEEWIESQEIRESMDGGFSSLESAEIATLEGVGTIVTLYFSDGTSGSTTLNYSVGRQEWRRYLTDEDISYLNDLLSQDDEDDTTQSDAPDILVDTSSVEEFVYDYYEAVEAENWATTYSLLSYTSRQEFTESEWIEKQQTRQASSGPPASVSEVSVSVPVDFAVDPTFTATVSFEDGTSVDILVVDSHSQDGLQRILTDEEIEYLKGL